MEEIGNEFYGTHSCAHTQKSIPWHLFTHLQIVPSLYRESLA